MHAAPKRQKDKACEYGMASGVSASVSCPNQDQCVKATRHIQLQLPVEMTSKTAVLLQLQ